MSARPKDIERRKRVSAMVAQRLGGKSLADIGAAQSPPCSAQNVHQVIRRVLAEQMTETVEQARSLELMRLDELLGAIWEGAKGGDIAMIDRCLSIMTRRSRLLGLDKQPSYYGREDGDGEQVVRVEIVGNPEKERVRWLESERERLLALTEGSTPPSTTLN